MKWPCLSKRGTSVYLLLSLSRPDETTCFLSAPRKYTNKIRHPDAGATSVVRRRAAESSPSSSPPSPPDGDASFLRKEIEISETRAIVAKDELEKVQQVLEDTRASIRDKELRLQTARKEWREERKSLKEKISFLMRDRDNADEDMSARYEVLKKEYENQRSVMRSKLASLELSLEGTRQQVKENVMAKEDVEERLRQLEEMMKKEQNQFQKDAAALEKELDGEESKIKYLKEQQLGLQDEISKKKLKLKELDEGMMTEQKSSREIMNGLWEELEAAQAVTRNKKAVFGKSRRVLRDKMNSVLAAFKKKARKENWAISNDISESNNEIQVLLKKIDDIESLTEEQIKKQRDIETESELVVAEQTELEDLILSALQEHNATMTSLQSQMALLQQNASEVATEIANAEQDLRDERDKQTYVNSQLQNERERFFKERQRWNEQLTTVQNLRRLEIREQALEYSKLQREKNSELIEIKTRARKEENSLRKTYRKQISEMEEKIKQINNDSERSIKDLDKRIQERTAIIMEIKKDVQAYNQVITQNEDLIQNYEGHLREQLKLGWRLCGKRVKGAGRRVRNIFKKREGEGQEEV